MSQTLNKIKFSLRKIFKEISKPQTLIFVVSIENKNFYEKYSDLLHLLRGTGKILSCF